MSRPYFTQPDEPYFAVQVHLHRDAAPSDELDFQRRTEDWLARHELKADGAQTAFVVVAERDLNAEDQANTLLALLGDPAVRHVRVGPLILDDAELAAKAAGRLWVEADRYDPLLHAALALYEAGRLDGFGLFEALGGFIHRPSEHVEDQP